MLKTMTRATAVAATAFMLGACSTGGTLGNVLGGVLNAPMGGQDVSATVSGVDTRSQQVFLQQSDGSTVAVSYDNRTQVVFQNQNYSVNSLQNGDQVTARIQSSGNNYYYTDYIQVNRSASNNRGTYGRYGNDGRYGNSNQLYSVTGTVRRVDRDDGRFTMNTQNGTIQVQLPYNTRSSDVDRFNRLRSGDYVRAQVYYMNNGQYQLARFY